MQRLNEMDSKEVSKKKKANLYVFLQKLSWAG